MAYPKKIWSETVKETVYPTDLNRIENGIEANDLEITKQKNPTIPGTLAKQIAANVTAIEENTNKINDCLKKKAIPLVNALKEVSEGGVYLLSNVNTTTYADFPPSAELLNYSYGILKVVQHTNYRIQTLYLIDTAVDNFEKYERFVFYLDSFGYKVTDWVMSQNSYPRLLNNKWLVIGDSLTEVNFRATTNYHEYIKRWTGCSVINNGISGATYLYHYQNASSLPESDDVDMVTVMLGINDFLADTMPIGAFGDTTSTTIYGVVLLYLTAIQVKYYNKKIGVMGTTPIATNYGLFPNNNTQGVNLYKINEAIEKVCQHLSIPFINLYESSGLCPWITECNAELFSCTQSPTGDGIHPNEKGHLILARKMLKFVESL